jgi:glycosyltransferase involved in cell wall biosynthesis
VTLGWNDLTIAVSNEVRASMHGLNGHAVTTITNGIDCAGLARIADDRAGVCGEFGIRASGFVVANVANLIPVKNHELLVRAFARLVQQRPDASLILVGQLRETTASVRRLVTELGIGEKVFITGPRTDVPRIVKAADAFALSSKSEGLPVSLLEAMALGKPVVCTRVGGIPGVVTDSVEGFLVPVDGPEIMAGRLAGLCDDVGLRQRMGQAGLAKVRAEYDIAGMVRRVEDEYRRLLEAKLKRGRVAESQSR